MVLYILRLNKYILINVLLWVVLGACVHVCVLLTTSVLLCGWEICFVNIFFSAGLPLPPLFGPAAFAAPDHSVVLCPIEFVLF